MSARARPRQPEHSDRRDRDPGRRACDRLELGPAAFQLDDENVDEVLRLRYRWLDMRGDRLQRNLRLDTRSSAQFGASWTTPASSTSGRRSHDERAHRRVPATSSCPCASSRAGSTRSRNRHKWSSSSDGRRARPLLPDRDLLARRGSSRGPSVRNPPTGPRDGVRRTRGRARRDGARGRGRVRGSRARAPGRPFPRMAYAEAMALYGSDKPDLRFGLEIARRRRSHVDSQFGVFAGAPVVRYLVAPRAFSRAELARLEEIAKEWGAKGLAYLVHGESGEIRSPIAKFLSEAELAAFAAEPGTTALFAAGDESMVARVLGGLRTHLGRELGLPKPATKFSTGYRLPALRARRGNGNWTFLHHPFTAPVPGDEDKVESGPGSRTQPALRPDLERLGARLGLDPDPPR